MLTRVQMTTEDLEARTQAAQATLAKDPTDKGAYVTLAYCGYIRSICVLKENTLENAKRLGYLDARQLYPDIPVRSLEEYAEEFYKLPEPGYVYTWAD